MGHRTGDDKDQQPVAQSPQPGGRGRSWQSLEGWAAPGEAWKAGRLLAKPGEQGNPVEAWRAGRRSAARSSAVPELRSPEAPQPAARRARALLAKPGGQGDSWRSLEGGHRSAARSSAARVTPCTVYSIQGTVVHSVCTVHSAQCTVCERAGPQLEGKQDCWAAEDQPGEHLQELLSLYVEQSPSEYTYCPGTCRH